MSDLHRYYSHPCSNDVNRRIYTPGGCIFNDSHHRGEIRHKSPMKAFLEPQLEPQVAACGPAGL